MDAAEALNRNKYIFLVAQRNSTVDEPTEEDIYAAGTVAKIIQMLRLPTGLMKILVEGESQGFIRKLISSTGYMEAEVDVNSSTIPGV